MKKVEAKAKANVAKGIPELIETAINPIWEENKKLKHERDAKYGWYRYDVRFAIPVYGDAGELERYNIFAARLLVNHSANGKKYLYDILNIKKGVCERISVNRISCDGFLCQSAQIISSSSCLAVT